MGLPLVKAASSNGGSVSNGVQVLDMTIRSDTQQKCDHNDNSVLGAQNNTPPRFRDWTHRRPQASNIALTLPSSTAPGATQNTAPLFPTETRGDVRMAGSDPPQMQAAQPVVDTANPSASIPPSPIKSQWAKKRKQAEGGLTEPSRVKKAKPERSPLPEFIHDPDTLRQMPLLAPRIPKGSGRDLILITMTEAKELYRLKDEQMRNIKVYRVEKAIFNSEPVLVHYYREDLVEFEAWKAYGGRTHFIRYLLQRKRAYDKRYPLATRPATFIFLVPEHYKPALKEMDAMDQRRHLAAEMEAAIQTLQSDVAEREIADSSHPTTPKKDKGKGRAKSYVSPSMHVNLSFERLGVIVTSHITHNLWYIRPKSSNLSPPPLDPRLSCTMPTPGKTPGNPDPPVHSRPSCTLPTPTSDSGKGEMVDSESEVINPTHAHSDSGNNGGSGLNASPASIFAAGTRSPPSTPSGADANNGSGSPSYSPFASSQVSPRALSPHPSPTPSPSSTPTRSPSKRTTPGRLRKDSATGLAAGLAQSRLGALFRTNGASTSRFLGIEPPSSQQIRNVDSDGMPKKITDESVLRQTPSQIPEFTFAQGGVKKPICIIKSDIKRWYRLDKDQVAHLKPYEIVNSRTEFDERGQPRLVYLYEERKVEFEAWKAHGGYERFLRYLLRLKRKYVKRKDWEHHSFPVSPYYRELLEQLEKEEKEKMRAREGEADAAVEARRAEEEPPVAEAGRREK